ncbi:MAG: FAD-dependent oxidoreductase [Nitrospirae bacterium]|nr:FAD-dependent oxidoreductase [Nitrospirota bacterium]NTW66243.1 FAD-dependent oxidoreductase [Nitrospirota bacterium]
MIIQGNVNGKRVSSKDLEAQIQNAVKDGARDLTVRADGQHGIGGRIWPQFGQVKIAIEGTAGQRIGSMGMDGTEIVVKGSTSDDTGWLNCGAVITVLGDVANGAHNAGAQGKLYVQGGGGARCDTMTKKNPRFPDLESWYFRGVGDSFAEFKAGGIAVVCGVDARDPENILGYRPCVGMVGGTIYYRGPIKEYSKADVKLVDLTEQDWEWLTNNMKPFLQAIDRMSHYGSLTKDRGAWKKLIAYTPAEKAKAKGRLTMGLTEFRLNVWEKEVGKGGMFGAYLTHDRTLLPYITTGEERRWKPSWKNDKYLPPCAYACPSRIPSHKRATLLRQGRTAEALALVLQYSPLPATVCGQVCPNLCMTDCTRGRVDEPLNIKEYGAVALDLKAPKKAKPTGFSVAVIGGGPGGLSAAWQLGLKGHSVDLYEAGSKIGGKLEMCIPRERLPKEILDKELSRFAEIGVKVHVKTPVDRTKFDRIYKDHDVVVVAVGAHEGRVIPFPGHEDVVKGIDYLKEINFGKPKNLKGGKVVVIGAGNVGMDIACQAWDHGAGSVTCLDIQKPAAFGKELELATSKGTKVLYPKVTETYDAKAKKIFFTDGTSLDADMVIISIGEKPVLDFLPPEVHTDRGYIVVNELGQSSDVKVFAIGDATKPGLVTHAIGQGKVAADVINAQLMNFDYVPEERRVIPYERIKTQYYEVCRMVGKFSAKKEADRCMSCGSCRDCGMCVESCYYGAITRKTLPNKSYEYVVDESRCIGCGFCAAICPCGVWEMVENV